MILIYVDSKNVFGGVEILADRFARYLQEKRIPFRIAEGSSTRLAQMWSPSAIVDPTNVNTSIHKFSRVIIPHYSKILTMGEQLRTLGNARIMGWLVHPNESFRPFFPYSGRLLDIAGYAAVRPLQLVMSQHKNIVNDFFKLSANAKCFSVMDGATKRGLRYFNPGVNGFVPAIPIPSPIYKQAFTSKALGKTGLHIGYLGRMDPTKFSALAPFVAKSLGSLKADCPITLHLVAEGPMMEKLVKVCRNAGITPKRYGFMPNKLARLAIAENTHFSVAMGTSALDIAGISNPCVIIDPALGPYPGHQKLFRFVHEIEDFTLGEYRDFGNYNRGIHPIESIIEEVFDNRKLGELGRDYVLCFHDLNKIFEKLLTVMDNSTMMACDIAEFVLAISRSMFKLRSLSHRIWRQA